MTTEKNAEFAVYKFCFNI